MKNIFLFFVFLIFFLAFFLRFYRLEAIPSGLEQDETSIGYNSYSILKTGKDEYGKSYPLAFKAFGEYKLPGYIYASVIPIKLFGPTEFSVRFVAALTGSLTVIVFYFLLSSIMGKSLRFVPLVASFLLAINPWHLHLSRGAFETTLALFFIILGAYMWTVGVARKKILLLFLAVLSLFASVYTYNIARLFSPLLFLSLLFFNKEYIFEKKQQGMSLILLAGLLLVPLFLQSGVGIVKGTLITSSPVVQAPFIEMRNYMSNVMPSSVVKLFFNTPLQTLWHYTANIVSYLSVDYFFVSGSTHGNHGIGTNGQFYLLEFIFIILGIVEIIRRKYSWGYFFLGWTFLVVCIASFTREVPQATRSLFMVVPLEVFSGVGLLFLVQSILSWKRKYIALTFLLLLTAFGALNIFYYFSSYYIRFPIAYAKQWRQEDKALSLYLQSHDSEYKKVIFDTKAGFEYSSLLFYTKYDPILFQKTVKRLPDDSEGFSPVISFGKYEFRDVDFAKDYQPGVAIITATDAKPTDISPVASFPYPTRPVAFTVKGEILSYPVQDFAYVLLGKK